MKNADGSPLAERGSFVKKGTKKIAKIILIVLLLLTTAVYALFMPMMSAAGWQYNVDQGNYPQLFAAFSNWMRIGSVLLTAAAVFCLIGIKPKFWRCNALALGCGCAGISSCMTVLYHFTVYADQNFSGIDDTMQPVSALYRDRLLPALLPFVLVCVISVWNVASYEAQVYRKQKRDEKRRREQEQAPKILGDE